MRPHDIAEPPSHPVAVHRAADVFRRDKPGPKTFLTLVFHGPENQEPSAVGCPLPLHAGELGGQGEPLGFREGQGFPAHAPKRIVAQASSLRRISRTGGTPVLRRKSKKASRRITAGSLS